MKRLMLALVLTGLWSPAMAYSGNELYSMCAKKDFSNKLGCLNYIRGVLDAYRSVISPVLCIPSGVTAGQVEDVVKQHLRVNLSKRHYFAPILIWRAAADAGWRCKK